MTTVPSSDFLHLFPEKRYLYISHPAIPRNRTPNITPSAMPALTPGLSVAFSFTGAAVGVDDGSPELLEVKMAVTRVVAVGPTEDVLT